MSLLVVKMTHSTKKQPPSKLHAILDKKFAFWDSYLSASFDGTKFARSKLRFPCEDDDDSGDGYFDNVVGQSVPRAVDAFELLQILRFKYGLSQSHVFFDAAASLGGHALVMKTFFRRGRVNEVDQTLYPFLEENLTLLRNADGMSSEFFLSSSRPHIALSDCAALLADVDSWFVLFSVPLSWLPDPSASPLVGELPLFAHSLNRVSKQPDVIVMYIPPPSSGVVSHCRLCNLDRCMGDYGYKLDYRHDCRAMADATFASYLFYVCDSSRP